MATAKKTNTVKPGTAVAVKKASSGAVVNIMDALRAQAVEAEAATAAGRPVAHVATIAYQWRSHPGSVAMNPDVKSYSIEPAMRAVAEACVRSPTRRQSPRRTIAAVPRPSAPSETPPSTPNDS